MASNGSIAVNNALDGAMRVAAAAPNQVQQWTVKSSYSVHNVNPDLKVYLLIGTSRFLIAPGTTPATHTADGNTVAYEFSFLAEAELTLQWEIS